MDDGGSRNTFVSNLKLEWNLFWESLIGEDEEEQTIQSKIEALSRDQIKKMIKSLSESRRSFHQQLESLNKEIELNTAKMESIRLAGGDPEETLKRIEVLTDQGGKIAAQLEKLDHKIKLVRKQDKSYKEESKKLLLEG